LILFVYFCPKFSEKLQLLATPWAVTAPVAILMLALMLKMEMWLSLALKNKN